MSIPFTQYLRPDGRRRPMEIERPKEIEEIARRFIASGGRYTCEELSTGVVSLAAEKVIDGEPKDVAICLSSNGPEVEAKVDELVRKSGEFCDASPDQG